ncbi:NAD(P)/FAD-dependent oxidoreductase [Crassaminicella thermophila]|uniref:NAD(P)/FAD-dependent oxidoreductase n=1 Tax=Crassaminicella thermophila TaxID=2599308 RepID=A0A5C0S9Q5_CRATE|nr:NAD(P)/FAD-dependent oxidoreductase [Crassaminicella thermophila]QEK11283.1 NAD(P)/FAD-dependent oxidoreductase [Crassaminicella thermophila]
MIRVNEVKLSLDEDISLLKEKIAKKIKIHPKEIISYKIFRESIDARRNNISFVYSVDVELKNEEKVLRKNKQVKESPKLSYEDVIEGNEKLIHRPVIIGTGPAGMFAGLILAQRGYRPILLERGQDVDTRSKDVENFWKMGKLNLESNVQFGEGGAGTFSDGKLTTRIKDIRCRKVLNEFVNFGAPEEILYAQKPHIGTDILKIVVKNMRKAIEDLGGEVHFGSKVTDFCIENGKIKALEVNKNTKIEATEVILAIGHSARDTYEVLHEKGIQIRQKPFSIGVRIEHPQKIINKSQYKQFAEHPRLGAADYRLTYQSKNQRAIYTFCMCPGGVVVAAASEENMVVTNGMSEYARNKENANSALLVQVNTEDFGDDHPLAGVRFQRKWESLAFKLGGNNYFAPAQLVGDFLKDRPSKELGSVKPSYLPGVKLTRLKECLPDFVVETMKEGLIEMDKKLKGFAMKDAVMIGVETRSSAPIRIERDQNTMESVNVKGLYPIGEGAGYAGGIISAAVDGIKAGERIIKKYMPLL